MLINLPTHLEKSIQLGNDMIELLSCSKSSLPNTFDLLQINLEPQKMDEIRDHHGCDTINDIRTINGASYKGCLYILEWWLKWWLKAKIISNAELEYTSYAIYVASEGGQVKVLDWWLKAYQETGLELKYGKNAINAASMNGRVDVLDWWLKAHQEFNLELKYDNWSLYNASCHGHVKVLDWWLKANKEIGLELKYDKWALQGASVNGRTDAVKWWNNFGLKLIEFPPRVVVVDSTNRKLKSPLFSCEFYE